MLIVALVLAVIGLAALVFAVVTSNELVAWVCIAASVIGVVLLIIDALQERRRRQTASKPAVEGGSKPQPEAANHDQVSSTGQAGTTAGTPEAQYADYPEDASGEADEGTPDTGEQVQVRSADSGTDEDEEPKA